MRTWVFFVLAIGFAEAVTACSGGLPAQSALPRDMSAGNLISAGPTYSVLHKFGSSGDGWYPASALINVNGTFYGTTARGGAYNAGTVFSISKSGEETVLHSFGKALDGAMPFAPLIDVDGTFYGTTVSGGSEDDGGTVFSITPNGTEKVVYSFNPLKLDGFAPYAGLINVKGTLYGTTSQGGDHTCGGISCGTIFGVTTGGVETSLYSFGLVLSSRVGNDGSYPVASLIYIKGLLYGTTSAGGTYGRGTVFSMAPGGGLSVLYDFGAARFFDGTDPSSALLDVDGTLYGTTVNGGAYDDNGTVFSITKGGKEKVVHSFDGTDGSRPYARLIDVRGTLYGTTAEGGADNVGTLFSMTKGGKETVLHSFGNGSGKHPVVGLLAVGKTLYGTTYGVTSHRSGNVFSLTP
jgi:uncharacterized repeat protein (TIGR03803 family)